MDNSQPYLYLTTIGRKTGNPHEIEIWFVTHNGNYYLMSEFPDRADWVKNVRHNASVSFKLGSRDATSVAATGRLVDRDVEPELAAVIARLMNDKYKWSDGQIVELKPAQ